MSERGRLFVDSWIKEYLHPTKYEEPNNHSESRASAAACYESALIEGIDKTEIEEEYPDLVAYIAKERERIIDSEVNRLVRRQD
jgi:hypothetical protein